MAIGRCGQRTRTRTYVYKMDGTPPSIPPLTPATTHIYIDIGSH